LGIALIYWVLSTLFAFLLNKLELRLSIYE